MNIRPVLVPPPPVNATTASTAGSCMTAFTNRVVFSRMAWNEMFCRAWIMPVSRPVSCSGKKPLGTIT